MTMPESRAPALFISDLHLQSSHPRTVQAFFDFLEQRAVSAGALYLLGDIFEYWAGDDDLGDPFHQEVIGALRRVSDAGVAVYWLAGNRDFLAGPAFALAAGATLLAEPLAVHIGGQRIVLAHGDAECTSDLKYMEFRAQVRESAWQAQFLALPLPQRKAIIAGLRQNSRAEQSGKSYEIMDVSPQAVEQLLKHGGAKVMIHGHTHRPALHVVGDTRRYVLPDWDFDAEPVRGGWIEVGADGTIRRCNPDGTVLG